MKFCALSKEDWLDEGFSNSTLKGRHFERQFSCDLMGEKQNYPWAYVIIFQAPRMHVEK